jgi:5-methylcytosine-specific restriction endonuclease McrA
MWVPIRTTSVQEAIGLVCKGAAKIIEPETYEIHDIFTWNDASKLKIKFHDVPILIRSTTLAFIPPEVILLTGYDGIGQRNIVFSRRSLFKRDRYCCQYCGIQPGVDGLTIDHIVCRAKGGVSSWTNCVLACISCNSKKADKSLKESGLTLRKVPTKPSWKILVQTPMGHLQSWEQFLGEAYWNIELQP